MKRILNYYFILSGISLVACSDLSSGEVETLLTDAKVYPLAIEYKMFCNSDDHVQLVIDKKLVEEGFVKAQLKHTIEDIGKPLIYFTEKANSYLIQTNDTLKSFDIQRIRVAEEIFVQVRNIEINSANTKAVVDYTTKVINPTPFIVLFNEDTNGEQKRRTSFFRKEDKWVWDGKIIKMPK